MIVNVLLHMCCTDCICAFSMLLVKSQSIVHFSCSNRTRCPINWHCMFLFAQIRSHGCETIDRNAPRHTEPNTVSSGRWWSRQSLGRIPRMQETFFSEPVSSKVSLSALHWKCTVVRSLLLLFCSLNHRYFVTFSNQIRKVREEINCVKV